MQTYSNLKYTFKFSNKYSYLRSILEKNLNCMLRKVFVEIESSLIQNMVLHHPTSSYYRRFLITPVPRPAVLFIPKTSYQLSHPDGVCRNSATERTSLCDPLNQVSAELLRGWKGEEVPRGLLEGGRTSPLVGLPFHHGVRIS